ncbi:MAG: hypothetical protein ABW221_17165 [Vicinamibacteria bacterium]
MPIVLDEQRLGALQEVLPALVAFKQAFGREASMDFIAELHVAQALDLTLPDGGCQPGCDAVDSSGKRYQIKCRQPGTQNIDLNNFAFDVLVLVNLDESYGVSGMWRIAVDELKPLCTRREKFRKDQVRQAVLKSAATKVEMFASRPRRWGVAD